MAKRAPDTPTEEAEASFAWQQPSPTGDGEPRGDVADEPRRRRARIGWLVWLSRAVFVAGIAVLLFGGYRAWAEHGAVTDRQNALAASFDRRLELVGSGLPLEALAAPADEPVIEEQDPVSAEPASDDPRMAVPYDSISAAEIAALTPEEPRVPGVLRELAPPKGEVLGRITIPAIDLEWMVIEGADLQYLKSGPGHMAWTPVPGQPGNAVISGHRTTYGAPFFDIGLLEPGDRIEVETLTGTHVYEVYETVVVAPDGVWVTHQWEGAWLTLTTCNPKGSARERLIVFSELVEGPNQEAIAAAAGRTPPQEPDGT